MIYWLLLSYIDYGNELKVWCNIPEKCVKVNVRTFQCVEVRDLKVCLVAWASCSPEVEFRQVYVRNLEALSQAVISPENIFHRSRTVESNRKSFTGVRFTKNFTISEGWVKFILRFIRAAFKKRYFQTQMSRCVSNVHRCNGKFFTRDPNPTKCSMVTMRLQSTDMRMACPREYLSPANNFKYFNRKVHSNTQKRCTCGWVNFLA